MNYDLFNQPAETFWTNTVHKTENNSESQKHLDKNRPKFGGQNKKLFDLMMDKYSWTVRQAVSIDIMSLPRRIMDIRKAGFKVSERWNNENREFKIWFMTEADIAYNKILLDKLQQLQ